MVRRHARGVPSARRRAPAMRHAGHADPRAHAPGVGRDGHDRFGRGAEQQVVDSLLVPIGDLRDLGRQGEDDVEVFHRQQVLGPRSHPVARGRSLALRAVPVLAGVAGDVAVATAGAARHMPAERLGPASLDRRHHLELAQADMPGIGLPPRRSVVLKARLRRDGTEDVSQLQRGAGHAAPPSTRPVALQNLILQRLHPFEGLTVARHWR